MGTIHFEYEDARQPQHVEFASGDSILRTALENDVPGIVGECGGEMNCGTCHIYVDDEWTSRLRPASRDEDDMLGVVDDRRWNSRLGCQIVLDDNLDGLRVNVADNE